MGINCKKAKYNHSSRERDCNEDKEEKYITSFPLYDSV